MNIVLEKGKLIVVVEERIEGHREVPKIVEDISSVWLAKVVKADPETNLMEGDIVLISGRAGTHTLCWDLGKPKVEAAKDRICIIDHKDVLGRLERYPRES